MSGLLPGMKPLSDTTSYQSDHNDYQGPSGLKSTLTVPSLSFIYLFMVFLGTFCEFIFY